MAIKERKQITGTEAQIKAYAGHNGVLAYATDTKHLHVLSGTAGTTTELANRSDIPAPVDISGKADTTYVNAELAKKQNKGDYVTTSALTSGLAGKANTSHTHTTAQITGLDTALAGKSPTGHTHTIANVTGLQDALNAASTQASNAIPKRGNRGAIAGYEQWTKAGATATINTSSGDAVLMEPAGAAATITVQAGSIGQVATKIVRVSGSNKTITFVGPVSWFGESAPTLDKANAIFALFYHDTNIECRLLGKWD